MTRKQIIGAVGAGAGVLALLVWFHFAATLFSTMKLPGDDPASRLAYAARWVVAPATTLLLGILIAARRGFLADAIDGTRSPASHSLEINLRYNQNTVEQVILAAIASNALSLELPANRLYFVPALAVSFLAGRATFWIGYLVHPMGRAFGMTVTVLPTICAYAWLGWRLSR